MLQWESLMSSALISAKSLGDISKQLQLPRSTVQTSTCKYEVHGTVVSLPQSGRKPKLSTAAERKLGQDVQVTTNQQQTGLSAGRHCQVCFTSTWAERLLCWNKLFLQTQHLKAPLKFAADHMDKGKNLLEEKISGHMELKLGCLATMNSCCQWLCYSRESK